jgi:hypothetical protein
LDITTSLNLVAAGGDGISCGDPTDYAQSYGMMATPPLYPAAYPPVTPPIDAYAQHNLNNYSLYEFELHHLMSDPGELLTECSISASEGKDIKPSVPNLSSTQASTPPAIL